MNHKLVARVLGAILCVEGVFLLLPMLVAICYRDGSVGAFALTALICFACGLPLASMRTNGVRMQSRDGFACVGLCWILMGAVGALPYVFTGVIPNYANAVFETISGFTTTGATVLTEIEHLPKGVLFWRALTQWMGGMGVLVLVLALLPRLGDGSANLMRAESPGPVMTKLVPKVSDTAKILYTIYVGLTVAEILSLCAAGMPLLDSVTNTFTTISTGGFCIRNASIAYYNSEIINWIIVVFMFLSGINFALLFLTVRRQFREALASEELRLYTLLAVVGTAIIAGNLIVRTGLPLWDAISQAAFQVVSVQTTTGFATKDFNLWPFASQAVLLLLMIPGACAGSTAGGVKAIRVLVMLKSFRRWLMHFIHPREVYPIRVDGRIVEEETVSNTASFFFAYMLILGTCTLVVSLDNVPFVDAISASLTTLGNVGPGLGAFGPTGNFSSLSNFSTVVLTLAMLLGRLEIVPLLILLFPSIWRKK